MIITLCGSARFEAWFHMWNEALSLAGHCVFGFPSAHGGEKNWYSPEEKNVLDEVHFDKIEVSDGVVFLNVMAYMGESTLNEFREARRRSKACYFLESWGEGYGIGSNHFQGIQDAFKRFELRGGSPIDTSTFSNPWSLLGPAGEARSRIVLGLEKHQVNALGFDRRQVQR